MSPIETLLARVREEHGWVATHCQLGPAMECTCGHLVDDHDAHQNQMIADALRGEGLVETLAEALFAHEYGACDPDAHPDHNRWTWHGDGHSDDHKQHFRRQAQFVIDSLYGTKETSA